MMNQGEPDDKSWAFDDLNEPIDAPDGRDEPEEDDDATLMAERVAPPVARTGLPLPGRKALPQATETPTKPPLRARLPLPPSAARNLRSDGSVPAPALRSRKPSIPSQVPALRKPISAKPAAQTPIIKPTQPPLRARAEATDLPARREIDLPAPVPTQPQQPRTVRADLPVPKQSAIVDLPKPHSAAAKATDLDLPKRKDSIDLPTTRDVQLPRAKHLDLPAPRLIQVEPSDADLPQRTEREDGLVPQKLPELGTDDEAFDEGYSPDAWDLGAMDLPQTLAESGLQGDSSELSALLLPDSLPPVADDSSQHVDLFKEVDSRRERLDALDEAPDAVDDGTTSSCEANPRYEGEADLGLQELDSEEGPGFAAAPDQVVATPVKPEMHDTAEERVDKKRRLRRRIGIGALGTVLVLCSVGVGLRWTSYGLFAGYAFEQLLPAGQTPSNWKEARQDARKLLSRDDYKSAESSLRLLGNLRQKYGLNRELLLTSLTHEVLVFMRHGDLFGSQQRIDALHARLKPRLNAKPALKLAAGAYAMAQGDMQQARTELSGLSQPTHALEVALLMGRLALELGEFSEAASVFQKAEGALEGGAFAFHDRVAALSQIPARVDEADALLTEASSTYPWHVGWRLLASRRALDRGEIEKAASLANEATGSRAVDGLTLQASPAQKAEAWQLLAETALAKRDWRLALSAAERSLALEPGNGHALILAGKAQLERGAFKTAETRAESALVQGARYSASFRADAALLQAKAYYHQGQGEEALKVLEAHPPEPGTPLVLPWHLHRGRILMMLARRSDAEEAYRLAIAEDPSALQPYLGLAEVIATIPERLNELDTLMEEADAQVTPTPEGAVELAKLDLFLGKPNAAVQRIAALLEAESPQAAALIVEAKALIMQGKYGKAEAALERLKRVAPDHGERIRLLGELAEHQGDANKALEYYRDAEANGSEDLTLRRSIARTLLDLDKTADAREIVEAVLALTPADGEAVWLLGRVLLAEGDDSAAVREMGRATMLSPTELRFAEWLALTQLRAGNLGAAMRIIEPLVADKKASHLGFWVLAQLQLRFGAPGSAKQLIARALKLQERAEYLATLADAEHELGNRKAAAERLKRATELDPSEGRWHFQLGRMYSELGQLDDAIAAFERARAEPKSSPVTGPVNWRHEATRQLGIHLELAGRKEDALILYRALLNAPDALEQDERREIEVRVRKLMSR